MSEVKQQNINKHGCVDCGSINVARDLNTNKPFCLDCKSNRIFRICYECNEIIKEEPFDGARGWHHNNKGRFTYGKTPCTCFEYKKWNDEFDEEYS